MSKNASLVRAGDDLSARHTQTSPTRRNEPSPCRASNARQQRENPCASYSLSRNQAQRNFKFDALVKNLVEEGSGPLGLRILEEAFRRRLLDDPALVHEHDPVS